MTSGTPPSCRIAALDGLGSVAAVRRVLRQLTLHRFRARLRDAGFCNLNLGIGQLVQRAQLREHRSPIR